MPVPVLRKAVDECDGFEQAVAILKTAVVSGYAIAAFPVHHN
jgi:hypothetical protein